MPRQVSEDLLRDVSLGYVRARVEVISATDGSVFLSTDPTSASPRCLVIDGSLTNDEARNYPGSATMTFLLTSATIDDVLPIVGTDPLAPVAPTSVQVSFFPRDDPVHPLHYGRYDVSSAEHGEGDEGPTLTVEMFDNSRKVDNAQFWKPDSFGPGPYEQLLDHLLTIALPAQTLVFSPYPNSLGFHSWDAQDSRLTAVNEIVTSIGFQIDWNYNGVGDVRTWSNPGVVDTPHWSFIEGSNLDFVSVSRNLSDEKAYNGVIASGESTSNGTPPVTAEAWDTNPASPTYFDPANPEASTYGPKPFFYVSQFIATQQQAQDAAFARLPTVLGMTEEVSFETNPHPGIIPGDVVEINRPRIGVTGLYVVTAVVLPLTTDRRMTVTCRERRVTA